MATDDIKKDGPRPRVRAPTIATDVPTLATDDIEDGRRPHVPSGFFDIRGHSADELFTLFFEVEDSPDIIRVFGELKKCLNIDPEVHGLDFYQTLTTKLTSWKSQSLWDILNQRLKCSEYKNGTVCRNYKTIIIGAGPVGLRTAIESLMLGSRTVVVEKRERFTRNNVLHLWPFLMTDFKNLGAKKFYGKFGSGLIYHISKWLSLKWTLGYIKNSFVFSSEY